MESLTIYVGCVCGGFRVGMNLGMKKAVVLNYFPSFTYLSSLKTGVIYSGVSSAVRLNSLHWRMYIYALFSMLIL